jgi:hypothetical protein
MFAFALFAIGCLAERRIYEMQGRKFSFCENSEGTLSFRKTAFRDRPPSRDALLHLRSRKQERLQKPRTDGFANARYFLFTIGDVDSIAYPLPTKKKVSAVCIRERLAVVIEKENHQRIVEEFTDSNGVEILQLVDVHDEPAIWLANSNRIAPFIGTPVVSRTCILENGVLVFLPID